jgi:lipoprotein-releasing system permease protein
VTDATPGLYDSAYVRGPINSAGAIIKGISVAPGAHVPDTLKQLREGSIEGLRVSGERPGIILGVRFAEQIGARVGADIDLLIPNGDITPMGPRPSNERVRVAGVFESGMYEFDNGWAFMALPEMQRLWDYGDIVNSVELNLRDIYQADAIAKAAAPIIGEQLAATTWQEQNRNVLDAFKMERIVTVVTIGLIQMVGALNILIALVMMVMEKNRDIAVLMSMGARASQIRKIFVLEGAMIGGVGTVTGLILGYGISYLADRYHWLQLDQQVYSLSFVPFEANWSDGIWIGATAMTVSLLATIYPARSATRISPVESMRYE